MQNRLIVYDTSNYKDFPIGGQLTSVRNFLKYLTEAKPEKIPSVILVGITTVPEELGKMSSIRMHGYEFAYLPVVVAETDLSNIQKSLRVRYLKGIIKYGRQLHIKKNDCNYIQTPEAYGAVKLLNPFATAILFSHGSFFDMEKGFRFFRDKPLILKGFKLYVKWILRGAKVIFTLDNQSYDEYQQYNKNVWKVDNSIICSEKRAKEQLTKKVIFVGRLSKGKNITPIIDAVESLQGMVTLMIVGNGEEYDSLIKRQGQWVTFMGGVTPEEAKEYMKQADIMIMNSLFEGIPMAILEALSFGLPVVTTDVGGIGTVLRYGEDSYKTDGSPESIAEGVRVIYEDYERYSNNAFQGAKRFDYRKVNEGIVEMLRGYWE